MNELTQIEAEYYKEDKIKLRNLIDILDQIQSDLTDLQRDPSDRGEEAMETFYHRMCANVTNYENLEL